MPGDDLPDETTLPGGIRIRPVRPGDEERLLALHRAAFPDGGMEAAVWRWKYRDAPGGRLLGQMAVDAGGTALAFYGAVHLPLRLGGEEVPGAQITDSMSHPSVRGGAVRRGGVFVETARAFFRAFGRPGVAHLLFGFPSARHGKLGRLLLAYRDLGPVRPWRTDLPAPGWRRWLPERLPAGVRNVAGFGPEADALWRRVGSEYPFAVARTADYLNWRYRDAPHRRYRVLVLQGRGGSWKAWAVVRTEGRRAWLADLLLPAGTGAEGVLLLEAAKSAAARRGAREMRAWMPETAPAAAPLAEAGFRPFEETEGLRMQIHLYDERVSEEAVREQFYYQMGDSDLV